MFNVSFIRTCVKRDSTSKLTSRSVGFPVVGFFGFFCMKSVELVMCDSDFLMRGYSVLGSGISCMLGSVTARFMKRWHAKNGSGHNL